jgi:hypothetical protein
MKVSIKEIYGSDTVEVPEGWEFVAFKKVENDEPFLNACDRQVMDDCVDDCCKGVLRIVVRRIAGKDATA